MLLVLVVLPIGLSVAYKRYGGGISTIAHHSNYPGHYGLAPLPMGSYNVMNNSVYLMENASVPFLAASSNDTKKPPFDKLPTAYGFNTLFLSNTSTALLDVPVPAYVSSIQQNLTIDKSWTMFASVHGMVSHLNTSLDSLRDNNDYWNWTFSEASGFSSLSVFELFTDDYDIVSLDSLNLPSAAQSFEVRREECFGQWAITKTDVRLLEGYCAGIETNLTILYYILPFWLDVLPNLAHTLAQYAESRNESAWRWPVLANAVATMFWARALWIYPYSDSSTKAIPELYYAACKRNDIFHEQ